MTDPLRMQDDRSAYARPGPMTDLSAYADRVRDLPGDLETSCRVVQGLLLHAHLGELYGIELAEERLRVETGLRSAHQRIGALLERDARPLWQPRAPETRQLGTCRDFALLLCALLRAQGRPARARCGFARYFVPHRYEDHWVCEVWDGETGRWRLVDAQIDEVQRRHFGPEDPLDVRRDEFLVGGSAWAGCRSGRFEAADFGLTSIDESGLWFVCGNLVRDVAALCKVELLPWDVWGVMRHPALGRTPLTLPRDDVVARLPPRDLAEVDRVAGLTSDEVDPSAVVEAYRDSRWKVPASHPAFA